MTCHYIPYRSRERSAELAFFEIVDTRGNHLKVWRYGWGAHRREIFTALSTWLGEAGVTVEPAVARRLHQASA